MGLIAAPIQFAVGDTAARAIATDQPVKFAAMECNPTTHRDVTEYIFGICTAGGVKGGIGIPGFDSFLVGFSTDTKVKGSTSCRPSDRPPFNTMLHWAFDIMVGICSAMIALGRVARLGLVAPPRHPEDPLVPARGGGLRRRRGRRARVRLDRDRGGATTVDRLQRHADEGRASPGPAGSG